MGIYGVQAAVEAGVDSIEHANYMDEETLSMLADSRKCVGTYSCDGPESDGLRKIRR